MATKELSEWYADQYRRAVGVAGAEGGRLFSGLISQYLAATDITDSRLGTITGRLRMSKFLELKMRTPLAQAGYNCTVIGGEVTGIKTHFALVYWPVGAQLKEALANPDMPAYITVSPTFTSRDGEFRRRTLSLTSFMESCAASTAQLAPFEEALLRLQSVSELTLYTETFGDPNSAVDQTINESRLAVLALSVALMLDLWDNRELLIAVHVFPDYARFITAIATATPALIEASHDIDIVTRMRFVRGSNDRFSVVSGIKLIPMFVREVNQPFDLNLGAWRELEVAKAVGDLVVSYVSPAFPLFNQWSYVERTGPELFENLAMHERYRRSQQMSGSITDLRKSRCALSLDCASEAPLEPELRTYHTEELSAYLYESLEYAQSHLLVSDTTMMHSIEDVGRTLHSWPTYVRRDLTVPPSHLTLFSDLGSFARLMFDYVWGAHCLHERLGVVHGDLHANNLTVYWWGRAERVEQVTQLGSAKFEVKYKAAYEDPVMLYVAGPRGEADSYVFPAAGISGCLIDYSRAILGPAFRPRLEAGRTPQFATNFYRDQVNRVMRLLHRYAPEYVAANQDAIKGAAFADFESVFRALCAVDFIAIGMSAAIAIEVAGAADAEERRPYPVAAGAAELARQIERAGRSALIGALHEIVAHARAKRGGGCLFECAAECDCSEFVLKFPAAAAAIRADQANQDTVVKEGGAITSAGASLIATVFQDYTFSRWSARVGDRAKKVQLVDAYNYNNSIDGVSSSDYAAWPRWARIDEIEKHLGDLKLRDVIAGGTEKFVATLTGRDISFEVLAAQSRADAERMDGSPVAAASSWLDE